MIIDLFIILFLVSAFFRGREIGFIRQLFSTVGFFGGLYIGSLLQPYTIPFADNPPDRALIAIATSVGTALLLLTIGEFIGVTLKRRAMKLPINAYDNTAGAGLSIVTFLVTVWIGASLLGGLPVASVQQVINNSKIIARLNESLPPAPDIIAGLSRLVNPNGFPDVFIGGEPDRDRSDVPVPDLGPLEPAVAATKASVVRVEGLGCGGIVEGTGFVVGPGLIATNAHVVAGIRRPTVMDANGTHTASVIHFNPNLDFAVLRTTNLAGGPLRFNTDIVDEGTAAAALGYPGGGGFRPGPAAVLDNFTARGRNIYGSGATIRQVYELKADIIPGNSGGPVITADGAVIGMVFAESTAYEDIGYALTANQLTDELRKAISQNRTVSTGSCAQT